VATFYTMFSITPREIHHPDLRVSPCHLMGSTTIAQELMKLLGIGSARPPG
jgi:NADH:ubiquinone oxidoreductase subunit E